MSDKFKQGDKVSWNTSQGRAEGTIIKKQTTPTRIKGHDVQASKSNPEYLVESKTSGKRAAHKPSALSKTSR